MPLSTAEASVQTAGYRKVLWLPGTASSNSVATLTGGTVKDVTYSFTDSGFDPGGTQNNVTDNRYTLTQVLYQPGTVDYPPFDVTYVWGGASAVAKAALADGTAGFFVVRYAVANATTLTIGQLVDIIPVLTGYSFKQPPSQNGLELLKQRMFVTGLVQKDVALVA